MTNYFPFFLQLRVVTGQLFLPELVVFKTMLWLKGFTLGFPGSNTQSFMIFVQDQEKFPPLPDPKIYKWSILVWELCLGRTRVWFPKSTKVKLITCFLTNFFDEFFDEQSELFLVPWGFWRILLTNFLTNVFGKFFDEQRKFREKNLRFVDSGLVKTCDELDLRLWWQTRLQVWLISKQGPT